MTRPFLAKPHVTPEEVEGFRRGALDAERMLEVSDHLRSCASCARLGDPDRATAQVSEAWRRDLRGTPADDDHVAPELLAAYAEGTLGEADREAVVSHLAMCVMCSEDAADLAEVAAGDASPGRGRRTPRKAIWAGAAAVAAAALLFVVWRADRGPGASIASRETAAAPAASSARGLVDGSRALRVDADGRVSGAAFTADENLRMAAALRDGRLSIPAALSGVAAKTLTLLGAESAAPLRVTGPVATAVAETRPAFSWAALGGARAYSVDVYDDAFTRVAQSPRLTGVTWTADRDLPRGRSYRWQVTAYTSGGEVRAPEPPAPEARFVVLDDAQAAAAADLDRRHAGSPLTLGVLYANLGLLDRAERQLAEAAAANPQSPVVAALRDGVVRARAGGK